MTGPLDRERITALFEELSDELKWTRTRAQIYIVGGAAMGLRGVRDRTPRDALARPCRPQGWFVVSSAGTSMVP